jgi:hypothetical protein
MFKVSPACLQTFIDTDRPGQGDTRLTLTPSVIPNANYVIMLSDLNCLKYFCVFFVLQSSGAQRLFDHSVVLSRIAAVGKEFWVIINSINFTCLKESKVFVYWTFWPSSRLSDFRSSSSPDSDVSVDDADSTCHYYDH